ncbi:uncharacterized protein LOC122378576 isoform X1 [Amphibalanus amphitrite]|uniref:uncharacterized protein LOC122378576 isoform X1 n=1 Tax=Amphibalanus amphitrite TaxID=1232801 RepID=UPI001C9259A6|nr:uncharacterized protein LOC122378576 isoform X1 [Amphibalanus amphitrite]
MSHHLQRAAHESPGDTHNDGEDQPGSGREEQSRSGREDQLDQSGSDRTDRKDQPRSDWAGQPCGGRADRKDQADHLLSDRADQPGRGREDQPSGARDPVDLLSARLGPDSACRRLLFDTVLLDKNLLTMEPSALQACIVQQELEDAIFWMISRPLMETLMNRQSRRERQKAAETLYSRKNILQTNKEPASRQWQASRADQITKRQEQETTRVGEKPVPLDRESAEAALCGLCRPGGEPRVVSFNRSGSRAEGLDDGVIGGQSVSDHDVMLEMDLGAKSAVVSRDPPSRVSLSEAPQLWVRPTDRPGFVTLHWTPTVRCEHERAASALSAQSVRTLMWEFCQILYPTGAELARPGPAVNFRKPEHRNGGKDHVPCQRLKNWWPHQEEFQGRHRQAEFPPRAVRDDMCRFGVHLVPTGMPGSATEMIEWRVSFSRAEVVAVRLLSPVQHATITTLKSMKNIMKESMPVEQSDKRTLKSYFIKNAVLWLVQDNRSEVWTGVSEGVYMALNWLEDHLSAGAIPCFFWPAINLVAELTWDDLQAIITAVRGMREHADRLLLTRCVQALPLDVLMQGDLEPLPELELRRRLGRQMVRNAVFFGTLYRLDAPCWESWHNHFLPALGPAGQHRLLQRVFRRDSGLYTQQCFLLMAWMVVDQTDLTSDGTSCDEKSEELGDSHLGELRETPAEDLVSLDAAPLLALLTDRDLKYLLGDTAAVFAWWNRQLQLPTDCRPAGMTAPLDTLRGRAELLLQPDLLLRAVGHSSPQKLVRWRRKDQEYAASFKDNYTAPYSLSQCRRELELIRLRDVVSKLQDGLGEETRSELLAAATLWNKSVRKLLLYDRDDGTPPKPELIGTVRILRGIALMSRETGAMTWRTEL